MLKTIILFGGPGKGTRFRPLSMDVPKPLFPVAGVPMIQHHIECASQIPGMKEIIIIGNYQPSEDINHFVANVSQECKVRVCYLPEYIALGTAGGMYHFRDLIQAGNPEFLFVMNGDVCGDFPLSEMLKFHREKCKQLEQGAVFTILGTEATRQQSLNYGCIVEDRETHEVRHYVEKPETFVSSIINCGIYLFSPEIFQHIGAAFQKIQEALSRDGYDVEYDISSPGRIRLEQDVFASLAGKGQLFVYHTNRFWSQVKFSGAAIYANRHYLNIYHRVHPERLAQNEDGKPLIIEDVFIHPTASVHPSATLGPNVTIGKNVTVGPGVRIRESIILDGVVIKEHCCILHSIIGWNTTIGEYTRVEGTPNDPNPNKPFAKLDVVELFRPDGRLSPSITVIGSNVQIPPEIIILNSIVLPQKDLNRSYYNQIIL